MAIRLLLLDVDGTLTDGGVYITEEGKQFKKFNAKDGMGIKLAIKKGVEVGIISHSHITTMVTARADMLGMNYVYVGDRPKLEVLRDWLTELNLSLEEVAYIGDDVNDREIMQHVGTSACPSDAVTEIKRNIRHTALIIWRSRLREGVYRWIYSKSGLSF